MSNDLNVFIINAKTLAKLMRTLYENICIDICNGILFFLITFVDVSLIDLKHNF